MIFIELVINSLHSANNSPVMIWLNNTLKPKCAIPINCIRADNVNSAIDEIVPAMILEDGSLCIKTTANGANYYLSAAYISA